MNLAAAKNYLASGLVVGVLVHDGDYDEECAAMDGLRFALDDAPEPLARPNCRRVLLPLTDPAELERRLDGYDIASCPGWARRRRTRQQCHATCLLPEVPQPSRQARARQSRRSQMPEVPDAHVFRALGSSQNFASASSMTERKTSKYSAM